MLVTVCATPFALSIAVGGMWAPLRTSSSLSKPYSHYSQVAYTTEMHIACHQHNTLWHVTLLADNLIVVILRLSLVVFLSHTHSPHPPRKLLRVSVCDTGEGMCFISGEKGTRETEVSEEMCLVCWLAADGPLSLSLLWLPLLPPSLTQAAASSAPGPPNSTSYQYNIGGASAPNFL